MYVYKNVPHILFGFGELYMQGKGYPIRNVDFLSQVMICFFYQVEITHHGIGNYKGQMVKSRLKFYQSSGS